MLADVAKTFVFDKDQAIRMREMHRIASTGQQSGKPATKRNGISARFTRLIQFRPQASGPLNGIGGAAA